MQAKEQEGDEVEESRPSYRMLRFQDPCRHDGGDGIGGVVQAVEEVEEQSHTDQDDQVWRDGRQVHDASPRPSEVLDHDADYGVGHVLEAVGHFLEMAIDLRADDESHEIGRHTSELQSLAY